MKTKSSKVCAGIVLYNPDVQRLIRVIDAVLGQVDELILVDNGSSNVNCIIAILGNNKKIHLHCNKDNEGIATALNQICEYAYENGYEWCLTLDHDTMCSEDMVYRLLEYTGEDNVGIVCPRVDYEGVNIRQKNIDGVKTEVSACMTSGSLTNLSAWKKVLGFKDSYFIDFVDNEFCMKLILNGYKIIRVNNCVMHHQLGDTVKIKLFYFFNVTATRHRPWRLYYMTRNNLLFIWEYKAHLGIIREYAKFGLILFNNLIYSDNRRDTWRYIRRGIIDAVKHKEGKMPL